MRWRYLIAGFIVLLGSSYIDIVRGPLLPILKEFYVVSYAQISWYLVLGNLAAIFFTFLLIPLLNRFSVKGVSIALCVLGLVSLSLAHQVEFYGQLLGIGMLIGVTISMLGTVANLLVLKGSPPSHQSRNLCGLHVMFTLGALLSPVAISLGLKRNLDWPWLQGGIAYPLFGLVILLLLTIRNGEKKEAIVPQTAKLSKIQWVLLFAFASYVGAEVLTTLWMVTYLFEYRDLTIIQASKYLTGFFAMMFLSRLICFFSLKPEWERKIMIGSLVTAAFCFILGHLGWLWAFCLAGLMGPYFPLFLGRITRSFPEQWRSLTVWIITSIQVVLVIIHLTVGMLTDKVGIANAYVLPVILISMALTSLVIYFEWEKKIIKKPRNIWN